MFVTSFLICLFSFGTPQVTVPQGSVGRWVGECEACGMDGKVYKPVDGVCYFPIDMARKPGTIEIARWVGGVMEKGWLKISAVAFATDEIDFPDERYVHLSAEDLARHYAEQAQIKPLFKRIGGPPRFSLPLGNPAEPLPEGKYFGAWRIFNGDTKNQHTGVDYAIGEGNPALAPAAGTVVLTGEHFFAGNSVFIHHGNGLVTMSFHLSEITASQGDDVAQGDGLGKIGSTGRSTGPHLHFGIRWLGARIDPAALLGDPANLPAVSE
jgi:murein DD-endopeptidase MepM/ murein hydrolase activator NlpD